MTALDSSLPLPPEPQPHPPRPHPGPEPHPPYPHPGPGPGPTPAIPDAGGGVTVVGGSVKKNGMDPAVKAGAVPSAMTLNNLEASKELMSPDDASEVTYDEFMTASAAQQEWAGSESVSLASMTVNDPQRWPNVRPQYEANYNGVAMMSRSMGMDARNVQLQSHFEFHYAKAVAGPSAAAATTASGTGTTVVAGPPPPSPYVDPSSGGDPSGGDDGTDDGNQEGVTSIWHNNTAMATAGVYGGPGKSVSVTRVDAERTTTAAGEPNRLVYSSGPEDFLDQVNQMLSPERTAGRLTDFAVSLYPLSRGFRSGGDTADARQAHADRMGGALDSGFARTRELLSGRLTSQQEEGLDTTRSMAESGLSAFVEQGADPEKSEAGGLYDRLRNYAISGRKTYGPPLLADSPEGAVASHPALDTMSGMLDVKA